MSQDNKQPQAFPYSGVGDYLNYSKGMTLRDYFAAKALTGILAQPDSTLCVAKDIDGIEQERREWAAKMSAAAYRYADAMLKARQ